VRVGKTVSKLGKSSGKMGPRHGFKRLRS
jgi:hypothetical protein